MTHFFYYRFLCSSSSATLRQWSNTRVTSKAIFLVVVFIGLIYIHIPMYYGIQPPLNTCFAPTGVYQTFLSLWNLIIWSWLPTTGMLVFGLLTVQNVRQGKRRVLPQIIQDQIQQNRKKTDAQLIQMMLVQSFVFGSTTTIYSIVNLYVSFAAVSANDALKQATDNYLGNVFGYIALIGPCVSFYLFTLSSQLFRRELISLFHWRPQTQNHQNANALSQRN